jgi:hypothetical protein
MFQSEQANPAKVSAEPNKPRRGDGGANLSNLPMFGSVFGAMG